MAAFAFVWLILCMVETLFVYIYIYTGRRSTRSGLHITIEEYFKHRLVSVMFSNAIPRTVEHAHVKIVYSVERLACKHWVHVYN